VCGAKCCATILMLMIISSLCTDCLLASPCCPLLFYLAAAVCRAQVMSLCGAKWCENTSTTATLMWHNRQLQPWQRVPMRSAALTAAVIACALPMLLQQGKALCVASVLISHWRC
jgi:hypothetical protein